MRRAIWDRHAIKAEIHRRGQTLAGLSADNGLEVSACAVALVRRHRLGEQAIARFLGRTVRALWPDRYPPSASRVASNTAPVLGASQNEQAA